MLMEVKNQIKVNILSTKYALEREMLNKFTFISNIVFMVLNNSSFIIQWIILYSIKDNIGGYSFKQVLLLWGLAAMGYGISRFFFKNAFDLSDIINTGKLDNYLVQPKNVLLSVITSDVEVSALGDILYGYIILFLYGFSIRNFLLYTFFGITAGFIITSVSIIFSSLAFWFGRVEVIANTLNSIMTNFATYPEGIFKGMIKILFYTILPLGFANYMPVQIMTSFNIYNLLIIIFIVLLFIGIAFFIFNRGLRKYSSTNLMNVRV